MEKNNTITASFRPHEKFLHRKGISSQTKDGERRTLLTIKVGAITQWARDILAIILMWKLIAIIY